MKVAMNRTLLGTITTKAEATWTGGEVNRINYVAWVRHWVEIGRQWQRDLETEGLKLTAARVKELCDWHVEFANRYLEDRKQR